MARTSGVGSVWDDPGGELLDKHGRPIPTGGGYVPHSIPGNVTFKGPGMQAAPAPRKIVAYRADEKSMSRNIEAWELWFLLDLVIKNNTDPSTGMVTQVSPDEYNRLTPDVKRHFMPVYDDTTED